MEQNTYQSVKSSIELKDDIGDVVGEETIFDGSGDVKVLNAEIVAVISCEGYASCRNCDVKLFK